jgi:hypothetical protein
MQPHVETKKIGSKGEIMENKEVGRKQEKKKQKKGPMVLIKFQSYEIRHIIHITHITNLTASCEIKIGKTRI